MPAGEECQNEHPEDQHAWSILFCFSPPFVFHARTLIHTLNFRHIINNNSPSTIVETGFFICFYLREPLYPNYPLIRIYVLKSNWMKCAGIQAQIAIRGNITQKKKKKWRKLHSKNDGVARIQAMWFNFIYVHVLSKACLWTLRQFSSVCCARLPQVNERVVVPSFFSFGIFNLFQFTLFLDVTQLVRHNWPYVQILGFNIRIR